MNKRFRSILNYDYKSEIGERFTLPSMTVPGDALTPRQLLENFIKGAPLPRDKKPYYENGGFDDDDPTRSPDFELADFTQHQLMLNEEIEERQRKKKAGTQPKPNATKGANAPKGEGSDETEGSVADDPEGAADPEGK